MLTWLLGINLHRVLMVIGTGFTAVIMLLLFIAFKVEKIEKDEYK